MANTTISRTMAANNEKKLTVSMWVKRAKLGSEQFLLVSYYSGSYWGEIKFNADDTITFADYRSSYILKLITNAKFRDPHAWMHIVCNYDISIGSPTAKIYVNGELQTLSTNTIYSQNATTSWNTDYSLRIGSYNSNTYFDGSMADFYFIQSYTYEASTFGETDSTTGIWKPITNPSINYGGTGGNTCHLKFEDASNLDLDSGTNSVTFSTSGTLIQNQDNPANNFCTLSSLGNASSNFTLIQGNLYSGGADNNWRSIFGTLGAIAGKYYYEVKIISSANEHIGIASSDQMAKAGDSSGKFTASTYGTEGYAYTNGGQKSNNGTDTTWGNSYTTNDIIGVAFDLDNSKIYFSKNGTWQESGDPTSGSTGTGAAYTLVANKFYLPAMASYGAASNMAFNFGNGYFRTTAIASEGSNASGIGKFEYDVPTGYTALSTKGLNE